MNTDSRSTAEAMKRTPEAPAFVSPERFERDMTGWFRRRWLCVGRAEELAMPGDFVSRRIAGMSLLLMHARDGRIRAFFNSCRHRGTLLTESPRGHLTQCRIACPYHAWTFDCDGSLVGAPGMKEVDGFDEADWGLNPLDCETWGGFVFVRADRSVSNDSLMQSLADFPDKFAAWPLAELKTGARIEYDIRANWKLILQNYSECLHCPSVHPALARLSPPTSGENDPANNCYVGGRMSLNDGVTSMTADGTTRRPIFPKLNSVESRHVYYYILLPNMLMSFHPDYVLAHRLEPVSANRTKMTCEWLFEPATIARPDFDPRDAVQFWDLTNRQDWHMCELTQRGAESGGYEPGPYSNREHLLFELDQVLAKSCSPAFDTE